MKNILLSIGLFLLACTGYAQIITTAAGDSLQGYNGDDITAVTAHLNSPIGVALDGAGNLYIADRDNNRIRKVTPAGIITTIAGVGGMGGYSGDGGPATAAKLHAPLGIAIDAIGNIYFSDVYNQRIRKINTSGIITSIAGTGIIGYNSDNIPATSANLNYPHGVAFDLAGNIYFADFYNDRIRKINSAGIISTYAGTGVEGYNGDNQPATAAQIYHPYGIATDAADNLYIADLSNGRVRKVAVSGNITTIAGNGTAGTMGDGGPATNAQLTLVSVAVDNFNNIYIADATNHLVRKVDASGTIRRVAGTGLPGYNGDNIAATEAQLANPTGIAVDAAGNIYIADFRNNRIRHINSTVGVGPVITMADDILIYPNPCSGQFMVNIVSAVDAEVQVSITDLSGQRIKEFTVRTNAPRNVPFDVAPGIYILYGRTQDKTWRETVVVNR
ncbi:MAG: hypothetical protein K0Q79_3352 [Flavipsychrobacter sp.]|nr:hypothetical protein [Flavipsychrobacter sp.]